MECLSERARALQKPKNSFISPNSHKKISSYIVVDQKLLPEFREVY